MVIYIWRARTCLGATAGASVREYIVDLDPSLPGQA
jgi:hypothetical protein